MSWIYLLFAIMFELCGTTLMKLSNGLTKITPAIGMFLSYALCFWLLSLSLKEIEVSVAYAIWSAVGIVIISIIGIVFFHETVNALKIVSILVIVAGVIGLNLSGVNH
ncbi:multidrug efflux SMR transporter [Desulfosporosinus fructosivorans]|uniref:Multidrug efflux SMR transporter n=1 Tax=Desulfosporosinus fructosivorans TaxID=2018669 RepID=A0A4Z0R537_9FIRM|nr:multidrug efflux SMR transporter [Desulfosporosinus fructosivorans]TGE37950.1 multidrug efflux SMR transporter [Desulfosporosinus fructosivorans]